jgi:hypothetical protein
MGWVIFVLIALLLGRLFFLVLRVAAIDPHNIEATPKAPMLAFSSALACLAFFLGWFQV